MIQSIKAAVDHTAWLFFPHRFLFSGATLRNHRVPGWETLRFVDSQEELQAVGRATGDVFLGGAGNAFLELLLGPQSVFRLDGERHQFARHIMGAAMGRFAGTEYFATVDRYIDEALDGVEQQRVVALARWSRALTMRAMCKLALDIDNPAMADRYFQHFDSTTSYLANFVSYWKSTWKPRGTFSIGTIANRVVRPVDELVYETIRTRRASGANGQSPLDVLIQGQQTHGYDDGFIRDNIVSLLAAGYETTGAAIAWMLYWLSRTGSWTRLRTERAASNHEALVSFRKECLRYCPPIEILPRKIAQDRSATASEMLPDLAATGQGGEAPMVCPFVHRVHHDPSVHAHPEQFQPERFHGRTYRASEYMPFGQGRRYCLGAAVGQKLMDRTLDQLLARGIRLDLLSSSFQPVRRNVTIWPGPFLFARVSRHKEAA